MNKRRRRQFIEARCFVVILSVLALAWQTRAQHHAAPVPQPSRVDAQQSRSPQFDNRSVAKPSLTERERMLLERIEQLERRLVEMESRLGFMGPAREAASLRTYGLVSFNLQRTTPVSDENVFSPCFGKAGRVQIFNPLKGIGVRAAGDWAVARGYSLDNNSTISFFSRRSIRTCTY